MKTTILLAMLLTACGTDNTVTGLTPKATETTNADAPASKPAQAQAVQQTQRPALSVYGMADLPLCNVNDEGWIIYVQAEKSLLACLGGDWQAVDLRAVKGKDGVAGKDGAQGMAGPQGSTGVAGERGDAGDAGVDGVAGTPGATGAQGIQGAQGIAGAKGDTGAQGEQGLGAIPGPGLYWTDPDSLIIWIIVAKKIDFSGASCPTGFLLPTSAEHLPAKFHAYFSSFEATLPAGAHFWTGTLQGGRWIDALDGSAPMIDSPNNNSQLLYICHN